MPEKYKKLFGSNNAEDLKKEVNSKESKGEALSNSNLKIDFGVSGSATSYDYLEKIF